ncbi:histidinol-phosphatase (PHP family) [Aequitasia blattaphilus]|uniref:Histidinol-phosphatase n=1 Tax=Aequitasia blattaphilus TaxID=2949332 RepID=A0ABT1E722_9FIRM|nr:histidinol-phosphatase HisJ family protein [Aequitasia blattaphilus]MCP1101630.1 histidinol-phosphatase HisJ family protein [Aequitasia blattaphilus]MCR8614270.1 histidinol-phosphatase HisJ family protein [Aequitasia blattaphilus]
METNNIKADYHLHSCFSFDSKETPENVVLEGINRGFTHISMTDHHDIKCLEYPEDTVFDEKEYFHEIGKLKERYKDKIHINAGIEIGLQPQLVEYYRHYFEKHQFDFIIGSVHVMNGRDPYLKNVFKGKRDQEVYRAYLEAVLENVRLHDEYHVLGHLDYVVRYGNDMDKNYNVEKDFDLIDSILKTIIEKGKGIEINSAGIRKGLKGPHPSIEIIRRYKELGGEILTIGSDAHIASDVGSGFSVIRDILMALDIHYYTIFLDGNKKFYKVS